MSKPVVMKKEEIEEIKEYSKLFGFMPAPVIAQVIQTYEVLITQKLDKLIESPATPAEKGKNTKTTNQQVYLIENNLRLREYERLMRKLQKTGILESKEKTVEAFSAGIQALWRPRTVYTCFCGHSRRDNNKTINKCLVCESLVGNRRQNIHKGNPFCTKMDLVQRHDF